MNKPTAKKGGIVLSSKERTKIVGKQAGKKKDVETVPANEPQVAEKQKPMDAGGLKKLCSFLQYHGKDKKNPDSSCRELLGVFNDAGALEKRKILSSFLGPNGKSLKWASDFSTSELKEDIEETGSVGDFYTKP